MDLFYSSNYLKLKSNSLTQYLFQYLADSNLLMENYANNIDYISNSTSNYLIRNSKTLNHYVQPVLFADSTTNVNAGTAST